MQTFALLTTLISYRRFRSFPLAMGDCSCSSNILSSSPFTNRPFIGCVRIEHTGMSPSEIEVSLLNRSRRQGLSLSSGNERFSQTLGFLAQKERTLARLTRLSYLETAPLLFRRNRNDSRLKRERETTTYFGVTSRRVSRMRMNRRSHARRLWHRGGL